MLSKQSFTQPLVGKRLQEKDHYHLHEGGDDDQMPSSIDRSSTSKVFKFNPVADHFDNLAESAENIKPKKMEVTCELQTLTEDDNILHYSDGKVGLTHLDDLELIREIEMEDVTAVFSSDEGNMYWIAKGQGEVSLYDSATLELIKSLEPLG